MRGTTKTNKSYRLINYVLVFCVFLSMISMPVQADTPDVKVTSILLSGYSNTNGDTVVVGETRTFSVGFKPYNATNRNVIWTSSNTNVAKVNNGVVTTYKKGTAVITATSVDGNFKASHNITVFDESDTDYVWESGTWGSNIKWYYCSGAQLIITGSGDMKEPYHPIEIPWRNTEPMSVEIQEGITSLCLAALEGLGDRCIKLKLPSTITKIGQNAFYVFGKQKNINGVTYFGGTTYYGGTPEQYSKIDFGYQPFGGLPYEIEYCGATGHIESISEPILPTCRDYGKTMSVTCAQCEKEIVKSSQINYIDCEYEDGYCKMCGIADPTIHVVSVDIPADSYKLELNKSISISANVAPNNATNKKINWTSSNSEIASVSSNGLVTGKLLGRVTITATSEDGNKTDSCIVTVVAPDIAVTNISLNNNSAVLSVGDTETLIVTILPTNATNKNVSWSSSNTNVATVSENGAVTAKAEGEATITATTEDGGYTVTCKVFVDDSHDGCIVTDKVVSNTNLSCDMYFENSFEEQDAKAIVVFYDENGKMVQIASTDVKIKPGKVELSIDYEKKAYSTYKILIWNSWSWMTPLIAAK